ncbi:MAG: prepilin-type N-terminal cleavage/methylation domain-containing protein [Archangium sp.]|nr:prepilin-type N-terminal cleavage/methylation domain-containing protein [Archangium sp.]
MRRHRRGMTLVEMMMVVSIIGSLASLALPSFMGFVQRAKRAEQDVVLPYLETSVKARLGNESLSYGAYTAAWNPLVVPSRFDRAMAGWRTFGIDIEGNLRFAYRLDAVEAAQPSFTVTVRERVGDTFIYRTRDWQLCSGWILLSDARDGEALTPPLTPCSSLSSGGEAPGGGDSPGGGSSGGGDSPGGSSGNGGSGSPGNNGGSGSSGNGNGGSGSSGNGNGGNGNGGNGNGGSGSSGNGNGGNGNGGSGSSGNHGNHGDGNNGNGGSGSSGRGNGGP